MFLTLLAGRGVAAAVGPADLVFDPLPSFPEGAWAKTWTREVALTVCDPDLAGRAIETGLSLPRVFSACAAALVAAASPDAAPLGTVSAAGRMDADGVAESTHAERRPVLSSATMATVTGRAAVLLPFGVMRYRCRARARMRNCDMEEVSFASLLIGLADGFEPKEPYDIGRFTPAETRGSPVPMRTHGIWHGWRGRTWMVSIR